ncbi:MAG TPA: hypothetical protein VE420_05210, partial [Gemmatimonadales bacterium]|nr:hypothetical protein [Gemmatimonadales bacterium]
MDAPFSARSALAFIIGGAMLLASGALFLTLTRGDAASSLFQDFLAIQVIAAVLLWFLLAWSA